MTRQLEKRSLGHKSQKFLPAAWQFQLQAKTHNKFYKLSQKISLHNQKHINVVWPS